MQQDDRVASLGPLRDVLDGDARREPASRDGERTGRFLRVVRGALLKGQSLADMTPSLLALAIFVCAVTALALARYRTTLD